MALIFDIKKTISASAHLAQKNGGQIDVLYLMKMLYVAERVALSRWHRPITGDKFVSMNCGPVLSRTYDLAKGNCMGKDMELWWKAFSPRKKNTITLLKGVDMDWLSEREIALLNESFDSLHEVSPNAMISWLHNVLPEWNNPNGSSTLIEVRSILTAQDLSDEESNAIVAELDSQQATKALLASR
jgi:uncharacterized phage-associated protein